MTKLIGMMMLMMITMNMVMNIMMLLSKVISCISQEVGAKDIDTGCLEIDDDID